MPPKTKTMFITYASNVNNIRYICDLNSLNITELLEIMGISYIKVVKSRKPIFWRYKIPFSCVEPIPIGLN
jgi:hypothetical protein